MDSEEKRRTKDNFVIEDFFKTLLRQWWVLLLITIISAGIVYVKESRSYVPTYSATVKMYVDNDTVTIGGTKVTFSGDLASLVPTYCEILKTYTTFKSVESYLKDKYDMFDVSAGRNVYLEDRYGYNDRQLMNMVTCGSVNDTEVFYITVQIVEDGDEEVLSQKAINIANAIATVLPDRIAGIMSGTRPKVLDEAFYCSKSSPSYVKDVVIGAGIGLIVAVFLVYLFNILLNDVVDDEDWIADRFGRKFPNLGSVPDVNSSLGHKYSYKYGYSYTEKGDK